MSIKLFIQRTAIILVAILLLIDIVGLQQKWTNREQCWSPTHNYPIWECYK